MRIQKSISFLVVFLAFTAAHAQYPAQPGVSQVPDTGRPAAGRAQALGSYILGPNDVIQISALDAEELGKNPIRIEPSGHISLPLIGRIHAAGLTVVQLEDELKARLKTYIIEPEVAVTITEFRGQPVSVLGEVNRPGIVQLEGRKTLVEVLSLAGGLRPEHGHSVKVSRNAEWGPIPLPSATRDAAQNVSTVEINLRDIMESVKPEENITILPNDIITVPRGELIYVVGEVRKPGGFVLNDRRNVSILQVIAMAEGLGPDASAKDARIVRAAAGTNRIEIPVDLKAIMSGTTRDVALMPDDILFVPTSLGKSTLRKVMDTALRAVVYRGLW
jgi:polysaccharide export outer membrane protein